MTFDSVTRKFEEFENGLGEGMQESWEGFLGLMKRYSKEGIDFEEYSLGEGMDSLEAIRELSSLNPDTSMHITEEDLREFYYIVGRRTLQARDL